MHLFLHLMIDLVLAVQAIDQEFLVKVYNRRHADQPARFFSRLCSLSPFCSSHAISSLYYLLNFAHFFLSSICAPSHYTRGVFFEITGFGINKFDPPFLAIATLYHPLSACYHFHVPQNQMFYFAGPYVYVQKKRKV